MPIKRIIIGLIISIGVMLQASTVHAIYSPTIAKRVSIIRQHVLAAQQQNGTGNLTSVVYHLIEEAQIDQAEEEQEGKKDLALPAKAGLALAITVGDLYIETLRAPLEPVFMIFNLVSSSGLDAFNMYPDQYITPCLRDDIWMLISIREIVAQEMIKAYMLANESQGDDLKNDYDYLTNHIYILKRYGGRPQEKMKEIPALNKTSSSQYLFGATIDVNPYTMGYPTDEVKIDEDECIAECIPKCNREKSCDNINECEEGCEEIIEIYLLAEWVEEAKTIGENCEPACNYECELAQACEESCEFNCEGASKFEWGGCPASEVLPALNEVKESMDNFTTIGSWKAASWGSIWEMAEARARIRADEWIQSNQVTLTLAGSAGGGGDSLLRGANFDPKNLSFPGWDRFVGKMKTEKEMFKNTFGPVIPLFTFVLAETVVESVGILFGRDPATLQNNACYYWTDDVSYKACTLDQYLDHLNCRRNPAEAEADDKDIDCEKFKSPGVSVVASDIITEQLNKSTRHKDLIKRAETAFVYNMELSNVSENNIKAIDAKMTAINEAIKRGFEASGNADDMALPTLYHKLSQWSNKHGGGM